MDRGNKESLHNLENTVKKNDSCKASRKTWQQFENDGMTDAERIAFLEQLLNDEDEMDNLASLELVEMPAYLEEEILASVFGEVQSVEGPLEKAAVQQQEWKPSVVQYRKHRPPKWFQLFSYSVKITFAAACAVVALFRMPDIGLWNRVIVPDSSMGESGTLLEERNSKREQDALKWEMDALEREMAAIEREQETLAREAEAAKRQQEVLAEQEQRRRNGYTSNSFVENALQFITSKIFVGGIEND